MHLHNGICCTLAISTVHQFDFKIEALQLNSVVLVISPFVFLMIGQVARWAAEVLNREHQYC